MTKLEFLTALEARLPGLSEPDRRRVLEYYSEMIDDRTDDGLSQEAAVEAIGSLDDLVGEIADSLSSGKSETGRAKGADEKTFPVGSPFRSIRIEAKAADVTFALSENGRSCVVCKEGENLETTVTVENGILLIRQVQKSSRRRWFWHPGVSRDGAITVCLAVTDLEKLTLESVSGDVKISVPFRFDEVKMNTISGDIRFEAGVRESLKIKTVSGDLDIENMKVERLACETVSGDVDLENVMADSINCKTISGDIALKDCDAASLNLSATSGDIGGTLLSDKVFTVHTVSGDKDVPHTASGGRCDISTVSGDVKISIQK